MFAVSMSDEFDTFNRTIVELKCCNIADYFRVLEHLLIVP